MASFSNDSEQIFVKLLLVDKKAVQVNETLSKAGTLIEQWHGPAVQKESLKVFFLVLQVSHYLTSGQVSYFCNCKVPEY